MVIESTGNKKRKYCCSCLLFLVSMALLALSGCSDSSSSTPGKTFSMSQYFPLSSGWETDSWTLFIDEEEYDIDGVSTKAMVDTGKAWAYFWSNDEAGLRLHGIWSPVTNLAYFSPPVQLAYAYSNVGDKKQANHTLYSDTGQEVVVVLSELISREDITTPAGTFNNCLRFRFHIYPAGNPPEDYGYENVWLAKDVGFVKAKTHQSTYLGLFAKNGETRLLVSYYLSPSAFTGEELAVRETYKQWTRHWNQEDMTGITDLTHDSYYERCADKVTALNDWDNLFSNSDDYTLFTSIEDVEIVGDDAYVLGERLESYIDQTTGEPTRRWRRSSVRLKREFGEWKIYGDQLDVYPSFASVYPRVTPSNTTFASPVEITDCADNQWADSPDQIASLTVTGPLGSGIVDFAIPWDPITGWRGFWWEFSIASALNGFYIFEVMDVNGNSVLYTDYLTTATALDIPVLVNPSDGATGLLTDVTFQWQAVAGANAYKIEVYEVDPVTGSRTNKVISSSTDQTHYNATLNTGMTYDWRVRARYFDPNDGAEYDSESRCSYARFTTAGP